MSEITLLASRLLAAMDEAQPADEALGRESVFFELLGMKLVLERDFERRKKNEALYTFERFTIRAVEEGSESVLSGQVREGESVADARERQAIAIEQVLDVFAFGQRK